MEHEAGYRLLLVEDNPGDVVLIEEHLADITDRQLSFEAASSLAAATALLASREFDGIILDLTLSDSTGIDTLAQIRQRAPLVPVIVYTGLDPDRAFRQKVLGMGALECIGKNEPPGKMLTRSVYWMLQQKGAELQHRQFERIVNAMPDAVIVTNAAGKVLFVNDAAYRLFDRRTEDFVDERIGFAVKEGGVSEIDVNRGGDRRNCEMRIVECEWNAAPAFLAIIRDVTEQKRLREELQHAQKMDAIGLLAGGVAHDFNNLLLVMLVYAEMLRDECDATDPRHPEIVEIVQAIDRAQALTRQLLAFSRKQPTEPTVLNLGDVITGFHSMLRRTLPANIEIVTLSPDEVWPVLADKGLLEQVLMNLAVNARDAMPSGGRFEVAIENRRIQEGCDHGLPAGDYVAARVSDSGTGIAPEHLERIFDPFFTTKERGRGTGLGLSMCYGIIAQAGGLLTVESKLGSGTSFQILLPRTERPAPLAGPVDDTAEHLKGKETVLIVEDDQAVMRATVAALKKGGYVTLTAANGDEARRLLQKHGEQVDLVLSDVVMPQLGGPELAELLGKEKSSIPVIFMTGYSDYPVTTESGDHRIARHRAIMKPFRPSELLIIVREVLDEGKGPKPSIA